jgi:hypothetical protein
MSNTTRAVLGLALVLLGLFWGDIKDRVPTIIPSPEPTPTIVIEEPSDEVINRVKPIADLVTGDEDRIKLAIFNNIFSQRCIGWKADAQQFNDIYVMAGKNVYGDSMRGKYNGYGQGLNGLFKSTLGVENHDVTSKEKEALSEDFRGLAYSLAN